MDADVIIVGSGAGGATLARALAPSGLSIMVLERGPYLPREKENWDAATLFKTHRYHTAEQWRDATGRLFHPVTGYHVGGNTKFYGAAVLRRRESDFAARRHVDGESVSWPIRYEDLRRHYDTAEAWYYVHGEKGGDPTEPARDPYPYPPMAHEPYIAGVAADLARLGLHPFHLPLAINRMADALPDSPCIRCDTCDGFPCLVHAKGDSEVSAMRPALAYPTVRLRSGMRVRRLRADPSGRRVVELEADGPDGPQTLRARVFVLSAGAVNSAALLLLSGSEAHPAGLANASGLVGRNYMCHLNTVCVAVDPRRPNPTVFQKTIGCNDFYEGSGDQAFPYPLGHVQGLGKLTPAILKSQRPELPQWFASWIAHHSCDWWLSTEDLARPDNRVTVDPDGVIRIAYRPNNMAAHERLVARWRGTLRRLGYSFVFTQRMGIEAVAHQAGTARFGEDPATSVLDADCLAHGIRN
ncbi:MAG: GMC family oxidoreductase N-terminal domain-containing protein, partial [Acidiferrobacteraceae bacterium]